ncbi:helix-turn-helix domain-containing protein [Clostridium sp.]|uniref:helix-turn-helix domain-containing protein n=1 Tax=Clostridium sp. TaxID=1506 RepID=UPI003463E34D
MEILSTGEKIKRARIYKGATLKEICGDKISVSKMSCIENNKVKPEQWILEMIADKLNLDISYLLKDVKEQIKDNIENFKNQAISKDIEDKLFYNLDYAMEYKHYDLAFHLIHILFQSYLDNRSFEKIQVIVSKYYDVCQKSGSINNLILYLKDMGKYFFLNKEYTQAASYFDNMISLIEEENISDNNEKSIAIYNKAVCHFKLKEFDKTYSLVDRLKDNVHFVEDKWKRAAIYNFIGDIFLKRGIEEADDFEKKAHELYDNAEQKICALIDSSLILMEVGRVERSLMYINDAIEICKGNCEDKVVSVLITCVENLLEKGLIEEAQSRCDEALNYAISSDDIRYIERAYYLKSKVLQKKDRFIESEMYMNFSFDALMKFGSKKAIYERYLEMGNMYFKLGEAREALKYLNLAINMERRI